MTSERLRRRIEQFLDEAEEALGRADWETAEQRARAILAIDPSDADAAALLEAAGVVMATPRAPSRASHHPRPRPNPRPSPVGATRCAAS